MQIITRTGQLVRVALKGSDHTRTSAFWPTVWLILTLVAVKASYVKFSTYWTWARFRDYLSWLYVQWLAAASQVDVLFALGAGILAASALWITRRRPRFGNMIWSAFLFFGSASVIYAVISRQVFAYYYAPLTYQLLALVGEPARLRSSLETFLTVPFIAALAGLPIVYTLLAWGSRRMEAPRSLAAKTSARVGLCIAVLLWLLLGRRLMDTGWFKAQDHYVTESPHWTLLKSTLTATLGAQTSIHAATALPEDVREFTHASENPLHEPAQGALNLSPGTRPRNVILIVLESVGSRYLGLCDSKLDTTPRLLAEQRNALVFDRYYAPVAWTTYSLISLLSSQRPPMQAYNQLSFHTAKPEGTSLATVLREQGYRTAFMGAGDPDWASKGFLDRNGFEEVMRDKELPGAKQSHRRKKRSEFSSWGQQDRVLFDGMREWIGKNHGQPFFLMAWTEQTHNPYKLSPEQAELVPPEVKQNSLGRYMTLIRDADDQIGKLLDNLRESGLAENTLVVITGDHGEAFGQPHGGSGHGFTVYDEEVRVPLMLWNPRLFRGGGQSKVIGSHTDLAPTLLDVLGLPPPKGWDGRSLFAAERPPRTYLFAAAWGQYLLGVREEDWKYIYDARGGREELYDLSTDPDEQKNLAASHTERAWRLRQRLAAWLQVEHSHH